MPSFAAFIGSAGPLAAIAQFLWVLQLALIIHVYKTGRPFWWMYILFMAPAIGGLAYVFLELVPDWRFSRGRSWKPRALRIRELKAELEENDIVKTRLTLAEELLTAGEPEEASRVAEGSLTGVFKDDPHTLASVARIRLETGRPKEALDALSRINTKRDNMLDLEVTAMRGRALFNLGRHDEAQSHLRSIETRYSGEEARYYLAMSLQAGGHKEESHALFEDIVKKFRRAGRAWRRAERPWFKLATEELRRSKKEDAGRKK